MDSYIPLDREFSPVPTSEDEADSADLQFDWGLSESIKWQDLIGEYRCVILAVAGSGKTVEFRQRAVMLAAEGKHSFFLPIENITADFQALFEVGSDEQFQAWIKSTDDAWFFLDSVDEARLDTPGALNKALRLFEKGIHQAKQRAHVFLSSRPYAWRAVQDRKLLDDILHLPAKQSEEQDQDAADNEKSALCIYKLLPLDDASVRRFCSARNAKNIDQLLHEVERANLWSLAERPFDLEGILSKWQDDGVLGGRLELLHHNIESRLRDEHNVDRAQRQPLNLEKALSGARRLAAAVLLMGESSLAVPDGTANKPGIDPEKVLSDWEPDEVRALLERGIFNDILYGAVRFRHREVRELLAAEWFQSLLEADTNRRAIESLFFREQYGEKIIPPRLRSILPWLTLFDPGIQTKALDIAPEIAVEGGEPARLPIQIRKTILVDIVDRIVRDEDSRSARDNTAIARIANPELEGDTQALIDKYIDKDDAIFFLGRLVWQGEMSRCAASFISIAADVGRNIHVRRVSARTVFTCGTQQQQQKLWQQLNCGAEYIQRELLAEIVDEADITVDDVEQLMISLNKLPPYERFKGTGLSRSLHSYIDRLSESENQPELVRLIEGMYGFLEREPFIERGECYVSKEYAWLLNSATHAVESLVKNRHTFALEYPALAILMKVPTLRFWTGGEFSEYKGDLHSLVPSWPELNDALFWSSIELARKIQLNRNGEALIDTNSMSWLEHYWDFDKESFSRLLEYVTSRDEHDDRLVALSAAHGVYIESDKPDAMLKQLKTAVEHDPDLHGRLSALLNPPVTEAMRKSQAEQATRQQAHALEEKRQAQARESWVKALRDDPDRLSNSSDLAQGNILNDQYLLMCELQDKGAATSRTEYANWEALVPGFGEPVARAYRDAAVDRWRTYTPAVRSEVAYDNSVPYSLIFAMAGIEIEASENSNFPGNLNDDEVRHLLRYIVWELNGLPGWFERVYRRFTKLTEEFVVQELLWQLENTGPEQPMHYILEDMVSQAPWLHARLAPVIYHWLQESSLHNHFNRHYCLHILVSGKIDPSQLAELARHHIAENTDVDSVADWYALYVDCDPDAGIPALSQWLKELDGDNASHAAQVFVTMLVGGRDRYDRGTIVGNFRTAVYLKRLYLLMHQYIRTDEDIDRTGGGTYSPVLRDDAQEARNILFNALNEIPGKASYLAIRDLTRDHPDPASRPWMIRHAYRHAESDGDLEPWSERQVRQFEIDQRLVPETHRQLFDLAVERLHDLKDWVENGDDSPARTWQKVEDENEMRNLITGALNQKRYDKYTTAQEPEIANSQRMDIWLQNTNVASRVPIELKLLDKNWSGPKLCERLRNQLIGDYMREEGTTCGVMLLVWTGIKHAKRWSINAKRVGLDDIAASLKQYWQSIASVNPDIDEIQVILIDLSKRAQVSGT